MTEVRRFTCDDMFRFNNVNLDPLTETVSILFGLIPPASLCSQPFYAHSII